MLHARLALPPSLRRVARPPASATSRSWSPSPSTSVTASAVARPRATAAGSLDRSMNVPVPSLRKRNTPARRRAATCRPRRGRASRRCRSPRTSRPRSDRRAAHARSASLERRSRVKVPLPLLCQSVGSPPFALGDEEVEEAVVVVVADCDRAGAAAVASPLAAVTSLNRCAPPLWKRTSPPFASATNDIDAAVAVEVAERRVARACRTREPERGGRAR